MRQDLFSTRHKVIAGSVKGHCLYQLVKRLYFCFRGCETLKKIEIKPEEFTF